MQYCLGAIVSAFLKSTELHAVKDHCDGLYILGPGSVTIWRCGLVGIGVTWLEWVCHCGCEYKILTLVAWKSVFHYQPLDENIELSAPPAPCLPRCCHVPTLMIMDWTSEPISRPQLNVVLLRVALVMVSVHSSKTLTETHICIHIKDSVIQRF